MKREFKTVEIDGIFHLYPIPVIKEKKYLLKCGSSDDAQKLITLIDKNIIEHPDTSTAVFERLGFHTDGKTPIYQLRK